MNKAILIGTLGKDVEQKNLNNGGQMFIISIATNEVWKKKDTGEKQELTVWHRCILGDRFKGVAQYLRKGSKVCVEGKIRVNEYDFTDSNNNAVTHDGKNIKMRSQYISVDSVELLGSKNDASSNTSSNQEQQSSNQSNNNQSDSFEGGDDLPF